MSLDAVSGSSLLAWRCEAEGHMDDLADPATVLYSRGKPRRLEGLTDGLGEEHVGRRDDAKGVILHRTIRTDHEFGYCGTR